METRRAGRFRRDPATAYAVKTPHKTAQLRSAISAGCIVMPGAFNAATARLIERIGFPAVYVSGAGLANATAGVPDIGLLTLTEVAQLAGYIARAVKIPALVDADTGFGGPANAAHAVREFERAGLAGMHIEDQVFPKRCGHLAGKAVISVEEMTERIRAAAGARADEDFLIVARTDARAVEGFDATVERARDLSRSRSRRHLSRGSGNRARASRFRPQNRSAADGEHDRVRPQPATERTAARGRWATASPSSDSPRSASRCTPSANVCAI
jgi:hypothetical protein